MPLLAPQLILGSDVSASPASPARPPVSAAAAYITGQTYAIDGGKLGAASTVRAHVVHLCRLPCGRAAAWVWDGPADWLVLLC